MAPTPPRLVHPGGCCGDGKVARRILARVPCPEGRKLIDAITDERVTLDLVKPLPVVAEPGRDLLRQPPMV
jgi:hypothetical protein